MTGSPSAGGRPAVTRCPRARDVKSSLCTKSLLIITLRLIWGGRQIDTRHFFLLIARWVGRILSVYTHTTILLLMYYCKIGSTARSKGFCGPHVWSSPTLLSWRGRCCLFARDSVEPDGITPRLLARTAQYYAALAVVLSDQFCFCQIAPKRGRSETYSSRF